MKYKRIVLLFPGQGSQHVGMGKEFYEHYDFVRKIYDEASQVLGYDMADICFKEHKIGKIMHVAANLNKTIYTQPAVMTTGYACYRVLEERCRHLEIDLRVYALAGHSLGEYTALLVGGALEFQPLLRLVHKRATYMTEAGLSYPNAGLMAVVDRDRKIDYERLCAQCKDYGLYVTLNNTTHQVVVGGSKKRMGNLAKDLRKEGKIGTLLKVEGPFHTPIMRRAAGKLKKDLEESRISISTKPVIANVSAEAIVDPNHIRKELHEQIYTIVNWRGSMERIIENGGDLFIEVGPRKVLRNMMRDIDPSVRVLNVEDMESLEKTTHALMED